MRDGVIEVSPGRFRETFGRYFEDFEVGHIYEHRPGTDHYRYRQCAFHAANNEYPSGAF